jgi:hypothetical protein
MPATDIELEQWLRAQPGVFKGRFVISRYAQRLHITFAMFQNIIGTDPQTPPIRATLGTFGYEGLLDYSEKRGLSGGP